MATSFSNPKAIIKIMDGFEYLKEHKAEYDIIIVDSCEPDGDQLTRFINI